MTLEKTKYDYLYSFKYDIHHTELSKLESRQLFEKEANDKVLFSDNKINPSISPFIKARLDIILSAPSYELLLEKVKTKDIHIEGFNVDYLILEGDSTHFTDRRIKQNDIGHCIEGEPDFENPSITYAICCQKNTWYFGILVKHQIGWHEHKKKPCSFSNSINMDIAKTLVSIASKGLKTNTLLDGCCGVGTAMLEACFAGFQIEGCDINYKAVKHSRENLAYYNYTAKVHCSDIKDLDQQYHAVIIDLPYNLYSYADDSIITNIIESAAKLSERVIIVSILDIESKIKKLGLKVTDFCTVDKKGKSKFTRNIWVCERIA
ncbi:methyltransferase [uncultured Arcticibacterium sp.]|uniref:TRM11 family SAM-dependent methyltransferase n=1 Tax=uncultured Arcticibacterium sp. TaxID=2173042 RepID=UPI0030F4DA18